MEKLWAPWRMEYIKNAQADGDECIFCEMPAQQDDKSNLIAHRSDLSYVILNKYPYNNGHIMVVPYVHESDFTNFSDEILLDMQHLLQLSIKALHMTMGPHGINIGVNLGRSAGAGIDEHLHYHLVPRWNGDTNYMPILAGTKVISESLADSWEKLHQAFNELVAENP
jgi:ATP adenylyltransferase